VLALGVLAAPWRSACRCGPGANLGGAGGVAVRDRAGVRRGLSLVLKREPYTPALGAGGALIVLGVLVGEVGAPGGRGES